MERLVLVHGAWHDHRCWDLLADRTRRSGVETVAVDLPVGDPAAGIDDYVEAVAAVLDPEGGDTVVAHSLGGLILPVVADRFAVADIVYVAAFVPEPGRSFAEQAEAEPDLFSSSWAELAGLQIGFEDGSSEWPPEAAIEAFYHDCDATIAARAAGQLRRQQWGIAGERCPLSAQPDVPTRYFACRLDRSISPDWGVRVARDVLGVEAEVLDTSHSPMLARPDELAARLLG